MAVLGRLFVITNTVLGAVVLFWVWSLIAKAGMATASVRSETESTSPALVSLDQRLWLELSVSDGIEVNIVSMPG